MNWIYQGQEITSLEQIEEILGYQPYGFIYCIVLIHEGNSFEYYGKKNFYSKRTKRASKKDLKEKGKSFFKRKKQKKGKNAGEWYYYSSIIKEMEWQKYKSSSKEVLKMIDDGAVYTKYIVEMVKEERKMLYAEAKHQFGNNVLESRKFLNDNILGRFFKKNIIDEEV